MDSLLEENTIDRPDISIIIQAYNEEGFIGETLKRIYELLPQTLKAEVIKGIQKLFRILSEGKCGMAVVTSKV